MSVMVFLIVALLSFLAYRWLLLIIRSAQLTYIENYRFNAAIGAKVKKRYPHLSVEQVDMVLLALKDYFYIWAVAGAECNTVIELTQEHHIA